MASLYIQHKSLFFATEKIKTIKFQNQNQMPSVGSIAISITNSTGIEPISISKPDKYMIEEVI